MKDQDKSLEQLSEELVQLRDARQQLIDKRTPIETALARNATRQEKVQNLIDEKRISTGGYSISELLEANSGGMEKYRHMQKKVQEWGFSGTNGYRPDTGQYCLQFKVNRVREEGELDKLEEAFNKILPELKTASDDELGLDEVVYFDLLEETFSELGIYFVYAQPQSGKYFLCRTTYGRTSQLEEFQTCREMLEYLAARHSYDNDW